MGRSSRLAVVVIAVVVIAVSGAVVSGCSSGSGRPLPVPAGTTDVDGFYQAFYRAVTDGDTEAFLGLVCPGVRPEISPSTWFEESDQLPPPGRVSTEPYPSPTPTTRDPSVAEWRTTTAVGGSELTIDIARIDGTWYLCER